MGTLAVIVISCGPPEPPLLFHPVSPGKGPSRRWESTLINRIKATLCLLWLPTRRTFFFLHSIFNEDPKSVFRPSRPRCGGGKTNVAEAFGKGRKMGPRAQGGS